MSSALSWIASAVGLAVTFAGWSHAAHTAMRDRSKPLVQEKTEKPSDAIQSVLFSQQAAWNRGDIPAFLTGYWNSPELTFAGSDGIVRGYDGLLERYKKSYPNQQAMGELAFSDLEITQLAPHAALVLGHWRITRATGNIGGVFTLVFRRFSNGWHIIHDHTSTQK
jgi:ketosteroid isomerase-like protein